MKKLSFILALLCIASMGIAQTDTDKTLVKTIDPKGATAVVLDFKNSGVTATSWDSDHIRLILEIEANMPEVIVAQLVKAGRYSITTETNKETGELKVLAANLDKTVTIKGIDLEDNINIKVQTPSFFICSGNRLAADESALAEIVAQAGMDGRDGESLVKSLSKINKKIDVEFKITSNISTDRFMAMAAKKNNTEVEDVRGITGSGAPKKGKPTLKDIKVGYGDILINGEPIDIE